MSLLLLLLLVLFPHFLWRICLVVLLGLPLALWSQRTIIVGIVNLPAVPEAPPAEDSISKLRGSGTVIGHQAAIVVRTREKFYLVVHSLLGGDVCLWGDGGQGLGASAWCLWWAAALVHREPREEGDHLVVISRTRAGGFSAAGQGEVGGPGFLWR